MQQQQQQQQQQNQRRLHNRQQQQQQIPTQQMLQGQQLALAAKAAKRAAHEERQALAQAARAEKEATKAARRQEQEAEAAAASALHSPAAQAVAQRLHAYVVSLGGGMPCQDMSRFYALLPASDVETVKAAKLKGCARGVPSFVQAHASLLRLEGDERAEKRLVALGPDGAPSADCRPTTGPEVAAGGGYLTTKDSAGDLPASNVERPGAPAARPAPAAAVARPAPTSAVAPPPSLASTLVAVKLHDFVMGRGSVTVHGLAPFLETLRSEEERSLVRGAKLPGVKVGIRSFAAMHPALIGFTNDGRIVSGEDAISGVISGAEVSGLTPAAAAAATPAAAAAAAAAAGYDKRAGAGAGPGAGAGASAGAGA